MASGVLEIPSLVCVHEGDSEAFGAAVLLDEATQAKNSLAGGLYIRQNNVIDAVFRKSAEDVWIQGENLLTRKNGLRCAHCDSPIIEASFAPVIWKILPFESAEAKSPRRKRASESAVYRHKLFRPLAGGIMDKPCRPDGSGIIRTGINHGSVSHHLGADDNCGASFFVHNWLLILVKILDFHEKMKS